MRRKWFNFFITAATAAAALLLAACAQATPATPAVKQVATEDPKATKMECQVVSLEPTQGPTEASMFPPPSKDDWVLGKNEHAQLTIIEYSDFQ